MWEENTHANIKVSSVQMKTAKITINNRRKKITKKTTQMTKNNQKNKQKSPKKRPSKQRKPCSYLHDKSFNHSGSVGQVGYVCKVALVV